MNPLAVPQWHMHCVQRMQQSGFNCLLFTGCEQLRSRHNVHNMLSCIDCGGPGSAHTSFTVMQAMLRSCSTEGISSLWCRNWTDSKSKSKSDVFTLLSSVAYVLCMSRSQTISQRKWYLNRIMQKKVLYYVYEESPWLSHGKTEPET